MKTLYISDMDGTLLDNDGRVAPETSRLLNDLAERGIAFSVATARTPATVECILEGTATADHLVVMTGATIWNRQRGRFEGLRLLPEKDVRVIFDTFRRSSLSPFCYALGNDTHLDVYHSAPELNSAEQKFVELRRNLRLKTFHLGHACPEDLVNRLVLFFAMGQRDAIVEVAEELHKHTDCFVSYYKDTYSPDTWLLEIFGPGVSKAEGIVRLKEQLGADEVVVFGDNLNDISMFKVADVAVAVGNALPEVKAAADIVIGPNTDNSVARFIADREGL